jgi:hypothetical protein
MHPLIKTLYDQSYKHEDGAKHWHDQVFDIEAFAQRIVFRCAMTAKTAVAEGKDPYEEILNKYGSETQISSEARPLQIQPGTCPEIGEINELI